MNSVEQLFEILKKSQEARGYHFNSDRNLVFDLLKGLLMNKDRYGYMSCPCRLASDDYDRDRDIICPCIYREPDLEEFGSCYCGLYVSQDWSAGEIDHVYVPERRRPEKISQGSSP
ncbi:MAG TPA: ferredoxin-thioredoxin reductase catalytic domain-containing protein [Dissulfurispiraceae bacterium]|nr:ferredoxin-thioredoxin reductase catalytic domain-containing protein [Dissulfurispiraceae bacterium]